MLAFLLHLAGAIALLLWAVKLIRHGVERGFTNQLRSGLRRAGKSPLSAAVGGAAAAFCLQSSTAVALLATSFAASGALAPTAGVALLLGADVGSALVVQALVLPAGLLIPIFLLTGVTLYQRSGERRFKEAGRILIGLALIFVSLGMIRTATSPLAGSALVEMIVSYLSRDMVSAFLIGGLLAFAMHSSVAAILTFVAFVAEGMLPVPVAAALVLGANTGGTMIPLLLTAGAPADARNIVIGNTLLRGGGALIALVALIQLTPDFSVLGATGARQLINLHLAFNAVVAVVGLPLAAPLTAAIQRLRTSGAPAHAISQATALDPAALANPERALACAAREVLRMGETAHQMLVPAMDLMRNWKNDSAATIRELEDEVDRMHFETKLYIAKLQQQPLTPDQGRRAMDLAGFANNLEEAGDQISTALLEIAQKLNEKALKFSDSGWQDLTDFHDRVVTNAQLALNVMITHDQGSALQLVEEKDQIRQAEQDMQARHLDRLRSGNTASIETSNLHQETLRALKTINTCFSLTAYPIAEEAGALLSSRLAQRNKAAAG